MTTLPLLLALVLLQYVAWLLRTLLRTFAAEGGDLHRGWKLDITSQLHEVLCHAKSWSQGQ